MSGLNYGNRYKQPAKDRNQPVVYIPAIGKWLARVRRKTTGTGCWALSTIAAFATEAEAMEAVDKWYRENKAA